MMKSIILFLVIVLSAKDVQSQIFVEQRIICNSCEVQEPYGCDICQDAVDHSQLSNSLSLYTNDTLVKISLPLDKMTYDNRFLFLFKDGVTHKIERRKTEFGSTEEIVQHIKDCMFASKIKLETNSPFSENDPIAQKCEQTTIAKTSLDNDGATQDTPDSIANIVVHWAQSNGICCMPSGPFPTEPNSFYFDGTALEPNRSNAGNAPQRIANRVAQKYGNAYLFAVAQGGTPIADDPKLNDWNLNTGELWQTLKNDISNGIPVLMANGHKCYNIRLITGMQGERDAIRKQSSSDYEDNLKAILEDFKSLYGSVPISIMQIKSTGGQKYNTDVRAAQLRVAETLGAFIWDADFFLDNGDGVHLTPTERIRAGDFIFDLIFNTDIVMQKL